MSNAFKCDDCGEYHDGQPFEKLFSNHGETQRSRTLRAELCESCSEAFAGGLPEDDDAE